MYLIVVRAGLGQAESDSDRDRIVRVCDYSFWDVSSPQDKRHGRWYVLVMSCMIVTSEEDNLVVTQVFVWYIGCTPRLPKHDNEDSFGEEGIPLKRQDTLRAP